MQQKQSEIVIRQETLDDFREVELLTRDAFWNVFQPGADEHYLVHKIRNSPSQIKELSLVATLPNDTGTSIIVGYILYTRSTIMRRDSTVEEVVTFGPVCVSPGYQNQGIGVKLILHSISIAKSLGFRAIVIYGYPSYYRKFGFENGYHFGICSSSGTFPKALQVLELYPYSLNGISGQFHESSDFLMNSIDVDSFDHSFSPREKYVTVSQVLFREMIGLQYSDSDPVNITSRCSSRDLVLEVISQDEPGSL